MSFVSARKQWNFIEAGSSKDSESRVSPVSCVSPSGLGQSFLDFGPRIIPSCEGHRSQFQMMVGGANGMKPRGSDLLIIINDLFYLIKISISTYFLFIKKRRK